MIMGHITLEHEIGLIRTSVTRTDPFPHLLLDNFCGGRLYKNILKYFPSDEQLIKGSEFSKQLDIIVDPGVSRANESWSFEKHMAGDQLAFWQTVKNDIFLTDKLVNAFKEKFGIRKDDVYLCGRIQVEEKGSGLGPHRDRFDKLVSCVIYLDECPNACGTKLLYHKNPSLFSFEEHLGYDEFGVVDEIQHKPNRMVCWPVVDNSFHSYFQNKDAKRKTLKLFLQEKQNVDNLRKRIAATKATSDKWKQDVR